MTKNQATRKSEISEAIQSGDPDKLRKALRQWLKPVKRKQFSESLKAGRHETRIGE